MISTKHTILLSSLIAILFIFSAPATASAASFNLTANKESFGIGDTFTVDVKIDSAVVGVNAAQATISFPKDTVQVTSVDKSSSAFDFWLQGPSYSNDTGQVTFIGGSQSGISGKSLEVLRVTFKVKGSGPVGIIFSDGAVTASDGSGTNVLTAMNGLQLTSVTSKTVVVIQPSQIVRPIVATTSLPVAPALTVPLYPDSTAWYADVSKFIVQWDLPRDITDIATAVDKQPSFDPTVSEGLFNNKTFNPLSDGVWYLHVRFKNSAGWGPTTQYRIGIDTAPPLSFVISSPDGLSTSNVAPTIKFETKDQPSGIAGYKILINNVVATTTLLTTYVLPAQASGKQTVVVEAIDQAGNMTEGRVTFDILEAPLITVAGIRVTQFWFFMSLILAIIIGGAVGWYLGRKEREQRQRRLVIAQRDVQTSFGILKKDIDILLLKYSDDVISPQEAGEMKLVLKRMAGTIEKNGQYIVQNIEEVES